VGVTWLASYPRSGNTWIRVLLANCVRDDVQPVDLNSLGDGPISSSRTQIDRLLGIPSVDLLPAEMAPYRRQVHAYIAAGRPRFVKIHDSFRSIPDGTPIIGGVPPSRAVYIVRNPLDVAASLARHVQLPVSEIVTRMADPDYTIGSSSIGVSLQVPQHLGRWGEHVLGWLDQSEVPVLLIRYEDVIAYPEAAVVRLCGFVGIEVDVASVKRAIADSAFEVLRSKELHEGFTEQPRGEKSFFSSGTVGSWRTEINDKDVARILDAHGECLVRVGYLSEAGELVGCTMEP
jgi:aryl sulfotransferase